jgi:hypothetical protein
LFAVKGDSIKGQNMKTLILTIGCLLAASVPVQADLVARWAFNETGGNTAFDYVGGHHGTLMNFPVDDSQWVLGSNFRALAFDGVNDFVVAENFKGVAGVQARTITVWIKTTNTGQIIGWGSESGEGNSHWVINVQDRNGTPGTVRVSGNLGTHAVSSRVIGSTPVWDGNWHHIAVTFMDTIYPSNQRIFIYINGELDNFNTFVTDFYTATDLDVTIGAFANNTDYFEGLMDNLLIYDEALSHSQIKLINGFPNSAPNVDLPRLYLNGNPYHLNINVYDDGLPLEGELAYFWEQINGPGTMLFEPNQFVESPTITSPAEGEYELKLTVFDGELYGIDTMRITVRNQPPQVDAGEDIGFPDARIQVQLDATVTDDGFPDPPGRTSVTWEQLWGPADIFFEPNVFVEDPLITLPSEGTYRLRLHANDGLEEEYSDIRVIRGCVCRGDLSTDGVTPGQSGRVDFGDFGYFLGHFGASAPEFVIRPVPPDLLCADISDDGVLPGQNGQIDFGDFNYFMGVFGSYTPTFSGPCLP